MLQKLFLIIKEIISGKFISLIIFFSISISAFSVSLFLIVGSNFNSYITNKFSTSIPPNTIKVSAKPGKSFLFFEVKNKSAAVLNDKSLKKIWRMKGVKKIQPVLSSKIPMQARINILGLKYRTDLMGIGVPYSMIENDVKSRHFKRFWKKSDPEKDIPVIVPDNILRAFNEGMAEANGIPKISPSKALGLSFTLRLGKSSIRQVDNATENEAVITGFTKQIDTLAVVIPLKLMKLYNHKYSNNKKPHEYLYCHVKVRNHESLLRVSKKLEAMGLDVEIEKSISKKIISLKKNVSIILDFLMYLIIILAVIAISFSTMIAVFNRIDYYTTLRIVGATKYFISSTIIIKYALLGLAASYAGLYFVELLTTNIIQTIKVSGFQISLKVPEELFLNTIKWGISLPVISTIPALILLRLKALNRD